MPNPKFWALCLECEHCWIPDKSRGKLRCSECGSRDVFRGTINEILDRVREKALKQKTERVRGGVCPVCGAKGGVKCRFCKATFTSDVRLQRHVREEHPEKVKPPGGQRKERPEDLSLRPETGAEKRRVQGRAGKGPHRNPASKPAGRKISADTEQPIHKRIGVKADKLERIVAEWENFPQRTEVGETGGPRIGEEQNVEWIHLVGKVTWRTAHRIFHEVLMKDAACTLPIGYKRLE